MATPVTTPADELLRPPQQTRSRASLDRVLQAGQELLEERGWEGFTVQEVSRRAKVSVGSIYARAPNKEALILAVYDYAVAELRDERAAFDDEERWQGLDLEQTVRAAMVEMVSTMLRHEPLLKVIMTRAAIDPVIRERGAHQIYMVAEQFQGVVLAHRDAIKRADPETAVEMGFRMAFATVVRRITFGPNFGARIDVSDDVLVDEMSEVMVAYLTSPGPAKKKATRKAAKKR